MQSTRAEITQHNNKYLISGSVGFATVPSLIQQVAEILMSTRPVAKKSAANNLEFDLSQVTDCNSAGLALVLEIAKKANTKNITVNFKSLPDALLTIAKAYGVENEIRNMCSRDV